MALNGCCYCNNNNVKKSNLRFILLYIIITFNIFMIYKRQCLLLLPVDQKQFYLYSIIISVIMETTLQVGSTIYIKSTGLIINTILFFVINRSLQYFY